jgi:hypothetical protein
VIRRKKKKKTLVDIWEKKTDKNVNLYAQK